MAIVIDGKEYDDATFSPELRNYITSRQELQVNKTRLNLELEKIEVLTNHFNKKIVDLELFRLGFTHVEKLLPHPHVVVAFGFSNTNPLPMTSSLKSTVVPLR